MTTDEMQRFLDMAALDGVGELEAARRLFRVLGIAYPEKDREERGEKKA